LRSLDEAFTIWVVAKRVLTGWHGGAASTVAIPTRYRAKTSDARFEGPAMLRVIGFLMVAFGCMGSNPVHADDQPLHAPVASAISSLAAKWQTVQHRIAEDETRLAACRAEPWMCGSDEIQLEAIAKLGRAREGRARIGEINRAVNLAIRPVSDERQFGVIDRWSGPLETLGAGQGDCEDYAILKLLALQQAGIERNDLRLVIVQDRGSQSAHAVAAVRFDGRWLLLDNRFLALVDMEQTHYQVLAQLEPGPDGLRYAAIGVTSGVM
jgi:predicted transglutaminase-like cysteine proteinase